MEYLKDGSFYGFVPMEERGELYSLHLKKGYHWWNPKAEYVYRVLNKTAKMSYSHIVGLTENQIKHLFKHYEPLINKNDKMTNKYINS